MSDNTEYRPQFDVTSSDKSLDFEIAIDALPNAENVIVPRPGQNWWYGGWFWAPVEELRRARAAQFDAEERHRAQQGAHPDHPWVWRLRRSTVTGLPSYRRGWLARPLERVEDAADAAGKWLDSPDIAGSLIGARDWRRAFPRDPEVVTTTKPDTSALATPETVHVHYRQWLGEFPVAGGHMSVHLAPDDMRVSISCTYVPLSQEKPFQERIKSQEAQEIARRVLARYDRVDPDQAAQTLAKWQIDLAEIVPDHPLFVLPFAGRAHLAYDVRFSAPDHVETWSVLVDAESGAVLGRPELLVFHSFIFSDSRAAVAGLPATNQIPDPNQNPADDFMDVFIGSVRPQPGNNMTPPLPNWNTQQPQGGEFEAINVAVHAERIFRYLRDGCGARTVLGGAAPAGRRLEAFVGQSSANNTLITGFSPSRRRIDFQSDDVTNPLPPIRALVNDPEVIYHEVGHGLMWRLNPDPFDNQFAAAPFARALTEGYAIYFARALGRQLKQPATPQEHFAVGAYQTSNWNSRWALFRQRNVAGQDYLLQPNLYPSNVLATPSANIDVYDVGMVCARALWSLRAIVNNPIIDRAALGAFWNYARGWTTSFEAVAEGVLDLAERGRHNWMRILSSIFGVRGVIAGQSIQALVAAPNGELLAGTDAGLMKRDSAGAWGDWNQLAAGRGLREIVDLGVHHDTATGTTTFYALTETGLYMRTANAASWSQVGPDLDRRPLCLAIGSASRIYVGSGANVQAIDSTIAAPAWSSQGNFTGNLALDLVAAQRAAGGAAPADALCVAGFDSIWTLELGAAGASWNSSPLNNSSTDVVTCVVARSTDDCFAGTANAGIFHGALNALLLFVSNRIATPADLGNAAVLCLAFDHTDLLAGTTAGVFRGTPAANNTWRWRRIGIPTSPTNPIVIDLPANAAVTALTTIASPAAGVATFASAIFAGTALHGLWQWSQATNAWSLEQGVQPIQATHAPLLGGGTPAMSGQPQPGAPQFEPIFLPQRGAITINLNLNVPVALWSIENGTRRLATSNMGSINVPNLRPGFYILVIGR